MGGPPRRHSCRARCALEPHPWGLDGALGDIQDDGIAAHRLVELDERVRIHEICADLVGEDLRRASASIERPFRRALRRRASRTCSSRPRTVIVAIASTSFTNASIPLVDKMIP